MNVLKPHMGMPQETHGALKLQKMPVFTKRNAGVDVNDSPTAAHVCKQLSSMTYL